MLKGPSVGRPACGLGHTDPCSSRGRSWLTGARCRSSPVRLEPAHCRDSFGPVAGPASSDAPLEVPPMTVIVGFAVGSATVARPTTLFVAPPVRKLIGRSASCVRTRADLDRQTDTCRAGRAASQAGHAGDIAGFQARNAAGARDIKAGRRRRSTDRGRTAAPEFEAPASPPRNCWRQESLR